MSEGMRECFCGYKFPVVIVRTSVEVPDMIVEITCPLCGTEYENLEPKVNIL